MLRFSFILLLTWLLAFVIADDLGCYTSVPIAESKGSTKYQTSSTCAESCSDYAYIAIKNGGYCYCLSSKPSSDDETDESNCDVVCNGYGDQTCGGTDTYTVFQGTGDEDSGDASASSSAASETSATSSSSSSKSSSSTSASSSSSKTDDSSSTTEAPSSSTGDSETTKVVTSSATSSGGKVSYKTVTLSSSSSTSAASDSDSSDKKSSGKSTSKVGPIVGGVVGGLAALGIIAALVFFFIRRRNDDEEEDEEEFYEKSSSGLGRGGTGKSRKTKTSSPLDMPMSNPFVHPNDNDAAVGFGGIPGVDNELTDPRLNPVLMGRRRLSEGSLADEADYSRKILLVANPDR